MVKISPSILAADFAALGEAVRMLEAAGADSVHVDIMDGQFVDNITFGPDMVAALARNTSLPLNVHLMIRRSAFYLNAFIDAGAATLSIHVEEDAHPDRSLSLIRSRGVRAGVVLNPGTGVYTIDELWPLIDDVLVMSVNPGFGGQSFQESALLKIRAIRARAKKAGTAPTISVDGGVNIENAGRIAAAGADVLIAGSAVFAAPDPAAAIRALREAASCAQ